MRKARRWGLAAGLAFAAVFELLLCTSELRSIPSSSMRPALEPGDVILCSSLPLRWPGPKRWNVLLFHRPRPGSGPAAVDEDGENGEAPVYVKRLVGLPGEGLLLAPSGTGAIRGAVLTVDEELLAPPVELAWTRSGIHAVQGRSFEVPDGRYFMLGDRGADSRDSRYWGPVGREDLLARAMLRVWPPRRWGFVR